MPYETWATGRDFLVIQEASRVHNNNAIDTEKWGKVIQAANIKAE